MGNCAGGCTSGAPSSENPYGRNAPKQFGVKLTSEKEAKKKNHVFFMVNSTAGGKVAANLLKLGLERFDTTFDNGVSVEVWFYDLKESVSRQNGFACLKMKHKDPQCDVRVVACGGDGTVKWVIAELEKVDCRDVPIGVIPFGTGNDMARCLGWGGYPPNPLIGKNLSAIRNRVKMVLESKIQPLDVWKVEIKLNEGDDSKFAEVKDGKETVNESATAEGVMVQNMINYISMGADAKVIFKFEQHRQSTQTGNKLVYAALGSGQVFAPPPKIQKFIEYVHASGAADNKENEIEFTKTLEPSMGARVLVFSNIPSYGGGQDIWKVRQKKRQNGLMAQNFGDGLLESLTCASTRDVGLMVATGGLSREINGIKRVAQESAYRVALISGKKVYIQVDGEGLKVVNGESMTITNAYQVNMLANEMDLSGGENRLETPKREKMTEAGTAEENGKATESEDTQGRASDEVEHAVSIVEERSGETLIPNNMSESDTNKELEQLEKDVQVTLNEQKEAALREAKEEEINRT